MSIFALYPEQPRCYSSSMNIKPFIRDVPDFPKPGIIFRDITPLLANTDAFGWTVNELCEAMGGGWVQPSIEPDVIAAIESRG
ncbi:hypothetical protein ACSTLC_24145, partial [Vibrio parahaemolyticus]